MTNTLRGRSQFFRTGQVKGLLREREIPTAGKIFLQDPFSLAEESEPLLNCLESIKKYTNEDEIGKRWGDKTAKYEIECNPTIFGSLLRKCGETKILPEGQLVHASIVKRGYEQDRFLGNLLIQMYDKCEALDQAWAVFARMHERNVFSWNIMMGAIMHHGQGKVAISLFKQMQLEGTLPNQASLVNILSALASLGFLAEAKQLHTVIVGTEFNSDTTVGNALISMYGKCGSVENAQSTFDDLLERNVISWSSMAALYAQYEQGKKAFCLFHQMELEGVIPNKVTFISILSACANKEALPEGKRFHSQIVNAGFDADIVVGTVLVNMYGKCSSLNEAQVVFDNMPERNVVSYNALIAACIQLAQAKEALKLFQQMSLEGVAHDKTTFVSILSACVSDANVFEGKKIHVSVVCIGCDTTVEVGNALINMYSKCGTLEEAHVMFNSISERNVVSYNCIISAFAQHGQGREAVHLLQQMQLENVMPDKVTFFSIISAHIEVGLADEGSLSVSSASQDSDLVSAVEHYQCISKLIAWVLDLEKCETLIDSLPIYKKALFLKTFVSNLLIKKSASHITKEQTLEECQNDTLNWLGIPSIKMDVGTYAFLLRHCSSAKALSEGKWVHACMINTAHEQDRFLGNLLIQMYGNCGALQDAWGVFTNMYHCNVFTWNLMIGACIQNEQQKDAVQLFQDMLLENVVPDKVTFVSILSICTCEGNLAEGKRMHELVLVFGCEQDVVVGNALVNLYGKCGSIEDARRIFERMPNWDVVSWNALIAIYSQHGLGKQALQIFHQMQLEGVITDTITFIGILSACDCVSEGKQMHAQLTATGLESDIVAVNAVLSMYGKCGTLADAQRMFDETPSRNVGTWNAMIDAYVHHGQCKEAIKLFLHMQNAGFTPDKITFISILSGCVRQAALNEGKWLHHVFVESSFESDVAIETALVSMYGKFGNLEDAQRMFDKMSEQDLVSWNAMIAAYAQHGHSSSVFQLFQQMQCKGVIPNRVTYLSLLSACSHGGLVDEGQQLFASMSQSHGIAPGVKHYSCLIDLFGRVGLLHEGEELLNNMPFIPTVTSWMTLLGNCRTHLDADRGQRAAGRIFELDPENATPYVMLSNIYAAVSRQYDDADVRNLDTV